MVERIDIVLNKLAAKAANEAVINIFVKLDTKIDEMKLEIYKLREELMVMKDEMTRFTMDNITLSRGNGKK